MKLAISALASILPQGEGIEFFNYLIYEGLPSCGLFTLEQAQEQVLLKSLKTQLLCQHINTDFCEKDILINAGQSEVPSTFEIASNLFDALNQAKILLKSGVERVNIYACELNDKQAYVEAIQTLSFSEKLNLADIDSEIKGSQFALAFSLESYQENVSGYFSVIEAWDTVLDKTLLENVACLESLAYQNKELVQSEFEYSSQDFQIALGSVASSFGYQNIHLDVAAFIKAVLQCYHRYIAAVPGWMNKNNALPWCGSSFYISEKSKSWFVAGKDTPRYCLVNSFDKHHQRTQILLSDRGLDLERKSQYFAYAAPHFFPLAGNSLVDFKNHFKNLRIDIKNCHDYKSLRLLAKNYYQKFLDEEDAIDIKHYRLAVLGEDANIVLFEIDALEKSLSDIFLEDDSNKNSPDEQEKIECKTPKGSYFTKEPLGEEGKVAFVFPGLGSSYVGLGQNIFQLFPSIFKESFRFTQNVGEELQEKVLYPRVQDALSFQEKRQRDLEIVLNLKDLGKTDTTYSSICAHVMTDVFKVHPDMAFGYSMGEANMMTALDVWQNPTELENRFKMSDIFKDRLHGELKTVKSFWGEHDHASSSELWSTYSLKGNKESVERCIQEENLKRVYITLINTDDNLVIAGHPDECLRVLEKLACRAMPMGFVPAIHCAPTKQEYEGIADLYSMPTTDTCSTKLYSSSCYLPVPIRQKAIAYAIAKCFCDQVDFPKLVNKVYQDGARIFLEAGAGRICSTWIDKILVGQKHVVVPLNAKGTEDSLTFARVMAKLFCHKVPVNLAPLYENVAELNA